MKCVKDGVRYLYKLLENAHSRKYSKYLLTTHNQYKANADYSIMFNFNFIKFRSKFYINFK